MNRLLIGYAAQDTSIRGDWSKGGLLYKRDSYIAYQNKILRSTPIARCEYFDGGIYRFDTTDLKNHAEDIIELARKGRVSNRYQVRYGDRQNSSNEPFYRSARKRRNHKNRSLHISEKSYI